MNFEIPAKPRYAKIENIDSLTITIPSRRNWFLIVFVLLWLSGWLFGGTMATLKVFTGLFIKHEALFSPENIFMVVWLCGWAAGLAIATYALVWNLSGKEEIHISFQRLKIMKKTLIWAFSKEYKPLQVKSLKALNTNSPSIFGSSYPYGHWTESIAFDYGAQTIKFGLDLNEAEAKMIVKDIQNKFPELCETQ